MNTNIKTPRRSLYFLILFTFLISGCISSILKERIPTFSKYIEFQSPAEPFEKIKSTSYPSWKNNDTQNVILIISSCDGSQTPVGTSYQAISENIDDVKVEPSTLDQMKLKKYTSKQIHGSIDGDAVEVQTFSFQHRSCTFLSALSGKPSSIAKDFQNWKNFLNTIEFKK